MSDQLLYKVKIAHRNMLSRCYNPGNASFKHYGARGIGVCDEWRKSRDAFVSWAIGSGAALSLSLDRIDNNAGYSPENCRWVTIADQLSNQRRNRHVEHGGTRRIASQAADELGIKRATIYRRIQRGMDHEAVLAPKDLRKVALAHGTRSGYETFGCRCAECRASNTERHRIRRARLVEKEMTANASR